VPVVEKMSSACRIADAVRVVRVEGKGRGVEALRDFDIGDVIEVCPIVILSADDSQIVPNLEVLKHYALELTVLRRNVVILGYGSLYNHSDDPNAEIEYVKGEDTISMRAIKRIRCGEEVVFDYEFDGQPDFLRAAE
jgi:uncharacterized protein